MQEKIEPADLRPYRMVMLAASKVLSEASKYPDDPTLMWDTLGKVAADLRDVATSLDDAATPIGCADGLNAWAASIADGTLYLPDTLPAVWSRGAVRCGGVVVRRIYGPM